jgi:hypothetical protein
MSTLRIVRVLIRRCMMLTGPMAHQLPEMQHDFIILRMVPKARHRTTGLVALKRTALLNMVPACKHTIGFKEIGVSQELGHLYVNCLDCQTTLARPLQWVSPYPADYQPGHEENAWGAFVP